MSNPDPNALIIIASNPGTNPLTFSFHVEKAGNTLNADYEFIWDFGDGNNSEIAQPTHTYSIPGDYDVSVEVIGEGEGKEGTDKSSSSSSNPPPPSQSVLKTITVSGSQN